MPDHHTAAPLVDIENRICPGCKKSAVSESGGLVVAFGQSFFHVDCFKCAKCNNQVTADTNLLLLSDGSPICADCSYNCNICQQPILDEAIMTGDDSYHAHCFKCKVCRNRIDELVFAKTTHGIYCMNCHNERMAKIRRHAQRKREKEKATIPSSARDPLQDNSVTSPPSSLRSHSSAHVLRDAPSNQSLHVTHPDVPARHPRSPSPADLSPPSTSAVQSTVTTPTERQFDSSEQSQSFVMTIAPPDTNFGSSQLPISLNGNSRKSNAHDTSAGQLQSAPAHLTASNSHLSPSSAIDGMAAIQRRKSYDDGVRPLNVLFANHGANQDNQDVVGGLNVPAPTSRADRRRSINPDLALQFNDTTPNSAPPEMIRSQTLPVRSDSPASSPSKAYFDHSIVRQSSNTSLLRDNASGSTIYHSPVSSPAIPENGLTTPEPGRTRSASHDPQSTSTPRPTTPLRSAPRPIVTLERPPQRSHSLRRPSGIDGANGHSKNGHLASTMPPPFDGSNSGRSSPLGSNGDRMGVMRPTSPSHRVDVPHSVESGTDTEAESSNGRGSEDVTNSSLDSPPRPPPKPRPEPLKLDAPAIFQPDASDESSPVERTSIATFIAPALPPIRFSMSGADFSDFLKSVGGIPSLKSLEQIAQQEEAPPKSPTSINTLIPQDDDKSQTDITRGSPGNSITSSGPAAPSSSADGATVTVPNIAHQFPSRDRAASEPKASPSRGASKRRERLDSNASLNLISSTQITVTSPTGYSVPPPLTNETHDLVLRRLQEALADANARGSQQLRFEKGFVETTLMSLEQRHKEYLELKDKYDRTKRASEQYIDGLSVAQQEYDCELVARRNAESEIIRLRVLLSGQVAKLSALTGENSRREARRQLSEELTKNLDRLEKDLSKLKAERDVTLAEVEELCSSKSAPGSVSSGDLSVTQLSRSLTMRLDNIKRQYQHELIPLTQQRDSLVREIAELKSAREQFLEETTVLNARNEVLAQLSAQYTRRVEVPRSDAPLSPEVVLAKPDPVSREKNSTSFDRVRPSQELSAPVQPSISTRSNPSMSTLVDDHDIKVIRAPKPDFTDAILPPRHGIFKWPGNRMRDPMLAPLDPRGKNFEHNFQCASALRFTRCDHCGDKLWGGSHFRCTACHINVHSRCVNQVHLACSQHPPRPREDLNGMAQQLPSIFGRELAEQVKFDMRWGERKVPVLVEKCIDAVDTLALDFEGIYRKTGGLSQTKMITQLFDRGDYTAFDLRDVDRFNDICSVTSVLKTFFRSLPVPLLTYDLHEEFIAAAGLKDSPLKTKQLQEIVDRLPPEHYHTLRLLALHLHRVRDHSDMNLMTARNLGVVFGPTLMWSRDPASEFSDMAGKALMVEWLVENAPTIFQP
ncbi:RhoGAP-domain-containing protein [Boletus edulis]|nr:RhoGAP-domain-containing protein [Boletus edulis]